MGHTPGSLNWTVENKINSNQKEKIEKKKGHIQESSMTVHLTPVFGTVGINKPSCTVYPKSKIDKS